MQYGEMLVTHSGPGDVVTIGYEHFQLTIHSLQISSIALNVDIIINQHNTCHSLHST